jgi:hypothetical protein
MCKNSQQFHSELPLENWSDLLPFVPRRQLAKLLLQIGNYHFSTILQYVLNEVGQIPLGQLHIQPPRENFAFSGPIVEVHKKGWAILRTAVPDVPMPKNVTNFKSIKLRFFLIYFIINFQKIWKLKILNDNPICRIKESDLFGPYYKK